MSDLELDGGQKEKHRRWPGPARNRAFRDNIGEIYRALFSAWWDSLTSSVCPGCSRQLLGAARKELYEVRERLSTRHAH
jgi:hypothetical protein